MFGILIFSYLVLSFMFFTLRSLKYIMLPDSAVVTPMRKRRINFLFLSAGVQFIGCYLLAEF